MTIVVFVLAGQWIDRRVGTDGVFTMLMALLGFGATLYSLIRELRDRDRKDKS